MTRIEELRARAADHARQLDAVLWVKVDQLAARWAVDREIITAIPRSELPYLEFGKSNSRRYHPADVEAYEKKRAAA